MAAASTFKEILSALRLFSHEIHELDTIVLHVSVYVKAQFAFFHLSCVPPHVRPCCCRE